MADHVDSLRVRAKVDNFCGLTLRKEGEEFNYTGIWPNGNLEALEAAPSEKPRRERKPKADDEATE